MVMMFLDGILKRMGVSLLVDLVMSIVVIRMFICMLDGRKNKIVRSEYIMKKKVCYLFLLILLVPITNVMAVTYYEGDSCYRFKKSNGTVDGYSNTC
jgi:NADH:ubiquinone oxidoreductase subunit 6 (subunit J)